MEERITSQQPPKQPKKKQAPTPPKAARPSAPKQPKPAAVPKPKKGGAAGLVVGLLLVIVVAALFAGVYFDIGGVKTTFASVLNMETLSAREIAEIASLREALQKDLDKYEKDVSDVKKREREIEQREKDAAETEAKLAALALELESLQLFLDGKQFDFSKTVGIIESMTEKNAAAALSGLSSPAEVAMILISMSNDSAAAILDEMDQAFATRVIAVMRQ